MDRDRASLKTTVKSILHAFVHAICIGLIAACQNATAARIDDMVALDAVYIPALEQTSAATQDTTRSPAAQRAFARLTDQWPVIKQQLITTWGPPTHRWKGTLATVERQIDKAAASASQSQWSAAHEHLEPIRVELMNAKQERGFDSFVDRLTAFHEPMEELATAGATLKPVDLTPAKRAELERQLARALAIGHAAETMPVDPQTYRLTAQRSRQFEQARVDVTKALSELSDAFRNPDDARQLKAATAVKPPFARAFTAFGRTD